MTIRSGEGLISSWLCTGKLFARCYMDEQIPLAVYLCGEDFGFCGLGKGPSAGTPSPPPSRHIPGRPAVNGSRAGAPQQAQGSGGQVLPQQAQGPGVRCSPAGTSPRRQVLFQQAQGPGGRCSSSRHKVPRAGAPPAGTRPRVRCSPSRKICSHLGSGASLPSV